MPKIPLYQDESRIGTARGVQIDPAATVKLSTAGIEREANFMQNVLKLGTEVVDQFAKNKQAGDLANYELKVKQLENDFTQARAIRNDLNDIEFQNQVVTPALDKFYNEWSEERGSVDFATFNKLWDSDKTRIDTKYTGLSTAYRNKQFEVDQINLANEAFNKGDIEEAESIINKIGTLSPEEKDTATKTGHYNRILFNMNGANTPDELRRAYDDPYLNKLPPNQKFDLGNRVLYLGKDLIRSQYKPTYDEGIKLAKRQDLTIAWVNEQEKNKTLPRDAISMFRGFIENELQQTIYSLDEDDKKTLANLVRDIDTFATEGEIYKPQIFGKGTKAKKFDNRIDALNSLYERAAELELDPDTVQWIMSPLTSAFGDESRNAFFLKGTIPVSGAPSVNSTYTQNENRLMGEFRRSFNLVARNLPANLYNNLYLEGMQTISMAMMEAQANGIPLNYENSNKIMNASLEKALNQARSYESIRIYQGQMDQFKFEPSIGEDLFPER